MPNLRNFHGHLIGTPPIVIGVVVVLTIFSILDINQHHCTAASSDSRSYEERYDEILNWPTPKELKKNYPYFLSGFDKEGHPIMVVEYGRWDVRATAEKGGEATEDYKKYTEQMWVNFFRQAKLYSTPDKPLDSIYCIADLEGFDLRQFSSTETIRLMLNAMQQFATANKKGRCHKSFIVNSNYLFQTAFNLGKPLLGELAETIVLFGSNAEKWKPVLLKDISRDQLPPWLGGLEGHKPVKVFG